VIAVATLTPGSDRRGVALTTPLSCLLCGDQGGADIVANLILFLPFAIGLRLAGASWLRTVALAAAVSFTVELLQLTVVPGRDASLSDLLSNSTSAAIGAGLASHLAELAAPVRAKARLLLAGGAILWLGALGLSAWLLEPAVPRGPIRSRWAGVVVTGDEFGGRVLDVHLQDMPMPSRGRVTDPAAVKDRLLRGDFLLRAELVTGEPRPGRSWIYSVQAGPRSVLSLYQAGRAAGVTVPIRGLRFGLREVGMSVGHALPADTGVRVRLTAAERAGVVRLDSEFGDTRRAAELTISPALGWMLIDPFDPPTIVGIRWLTALLLGSSLVPLGLWARRAGRTAPALGVLVAIMAAGLVAVPALAGLPRVHWSEWLAAVVGAGVGWALGPAAAYLERRCASPSDSESF
jgi:hypothetical protein